jgi:hypothetical protein
MANKIETKATFEAQLRAERIKKGICTDCGQDVATGGTEQCRECRSKHRKGKHRR